MGLATDMEMLIKFYLLASYQDDAGWLVHIRDTATCFVIKSIIASLFSRLRPFLYSVCCTSKHGIL